MREVMKSSLTATLVALAVTLTAGGASAGGYDTPMLYSARHMGMGGTAVAYVSDGSALFHNPAGLGNIQGANVIGDISLLIGDLQASPLPDVTNIGSELTVSPAFLIGGGIRAHENLVFGLAAYPVAAAGGEYQYFQDNGTPDGNQTTDLTQITFIEVTPGFAFNIDEIGLRFGASYRITIVTLERERLSGLNATAGGVSRELQLNARGASYGGFRVGAQYQPPQHPNLQLGFNYRHRTRTTVNATETAYRDPFVLGTDVSTTFVLPAQVAAGARYDFGTANPRGHYVAGLAFDFIWGFYSQNEASGVVTPAISLVQIFDWQNAATVRVGGEVRVAERQLALRLGYTYDGQVTNPRFPTAFGTPPTATHVMTVGAGWDAGPWELSFAFAHRRGDATVRQEDIDDGLIEAQMELGYPMGCQICGGPGDYQIRLNGIYIDFSYDFDM